MKTPITVLTVGLGLLVLASRAAISIPRMEDYSATFTMT